MPRRLRVLCVTLVAMGCVMPSAALVRTRVVEENNSPLAGVSAALLQLPRTGQRALMLNITLKL